ncbi:hypothetical protein HDV57DRAFT_488146 [Trichoderma longibrachiatum]
MNCQTCHSLSAPFVGNDQAQLLTAHEPCPKTLSLKDTQKRQATKFSRRRKTLLRKAHDLYADCNVDVYIVVRSRKSNQVWQYTNGYTPPTEQDMTRIYPVPIALGPEDFLKPTPIKRS